MFRTVFPAAVLASALAFSSLASAQNTIKIAILGPMSFVQGEHHWNGAEMARDEINKAGGINVGGKRMQVELIRGDTNGLQSVPDATNAMERVITRDKADFVIGGFRSEAVLAMQEVAMDYKKIFLGAGAADAKLGDRDWALGAYSIVDIHLFRLFWRMSRSLKPAPGTLPNLFRHYDRMMIRPAVKRTIEAESAIGYELPA